MTDSSGKATFTYTASMISGFCNITVQEAQTASTGGVQIDQKTNPAPPNSPYTVTVVAVPRNIPADGKSTSTVTITVHERVPVAILALHPPLLVAADGTVLGPAVGRRMRSRRTQSARSSPE